jgi:hypothetical protein
VVMSRASPKCGSRCRRRWGCKRRSFALPRSLIAVKEWGHSCPHFFVLWGVRRCSCLDSMCHVLNEAKGGAISLGFTHGDPVRFVCHDGICSRRERGYYPLSLRDKSIHRNLSWRIWPGMPPLLDGKHPPLWCSPLLLLKEQRELMPVIGQVGLREDAQACL